MNYYNPYFYQVPSFTTPRVGIFSRLLGGKGLTFGSILNGTQRALNFANQALPLVKQVKPMVGNAKTMFKVMNEFKRVEKPKKEINKEVNYNESINNNNTNSINNDVSNGPTFFI